MSPLTEKNKIKLSILLLRTSKSFKIPDDFSTKYFIRRSTNTLSFEQYRFYLKKEIFDRLELEEVLIIINVS